MKRQNSPHSPSLSPRRCFAQCFALHRGRAIAMKLCGDGTPNRHVIETVTVHQQPVASSWFWRHA